MKRVSKKVVCGLAMAMAVLTMTTGDVKVSAAGFYSPSSKTQEQTKTQTQTQTKTGSSSDSYISKEKTPASTSSYLTTAQQSVLNKLDTDYSKVNWGVQYSPKGMDGIIISVASYMDGRYPYLLVAITNIYDEDVTFSATGYAKGKSGQEVADISFFEDAIRPGNTIAKSIYCDDVPTGEIHWDSIELPDVFEESSYWESDWTLTKDSDGYYKIDYTVSSNDYMNPGYVTTLLLNKYGDVVEVAYDYNVDKGYYVSGEIQFYKKEFDEKVVDVAMFTNPLKAK